MSPRLIPQCGTVPAVCVFVVIFNYSPKEEKLRNLGYWCPLLQSLNVKK